AELRGRIIGLPEVAVDAYDGARIQNNAAALRNHEADNRLRGVEHPLQIDVYNGIELVSAHFLEPRVPRNAGVIHQNVKAPKALHHLGNHPIKRGPIGNTERETDRWTALGFTCGYCT